MKKKLQWQDKKYIDTHFGSKNAEELAEILKCEVEAVKNYLVNKPLITGDLNVHRAGATVATGAASEQGDDIRKFDSVNPMSGYTAGRTMPCKPVK